MIERTFIQQNMKKVEIEKYIKSQMDRAGFTKLDVVKTPLVTRLIVNVTRPGLAIGKGGQNIRKITKEVEERFGVENPQIEIKEIVVPELDAKAVVDKMKTLLERGYSWRSVVYKTIKEISKAGAQGVEIVLSGALGGKGQRKRSQRIAEGYMKKTGDQVKLVDFAKDTSYPKYGAIGIRVRIVRPETVFPDKVKIEEVLNKREEEKEKAENAEKEKVKAEKEQEKKKEKEKSKEEKKKEEKVEEKKEVEKEKKNEKPKEKKNDKEKNA